MDYQTRNEIAVCLLSNLKIVPTRLSGKLKKTARRRFRDMCEKHYVLKSCDGTSIYCNNCILFRRKLVSRYSIQHGKLFETEVEVRDVLEEECEEGLSGRREKGKQPALRQQLQDSFELRLPSSAVGMNMIYDEVESCVQKRRAEQLSIVLKEEEVGQAFQKFHRHGGHGGWTGLLSKINSCYYFPKMYHKKLRKLYDACEVCATLRQRTRLPPPAPQSITVLKPGMMWQWDHAGPFPEDCVTGHK